MSAIASAVIQQLVGSGMVFPSSPPAAIQAPKIPTLSEAIAACMEYKFKDNLRPRYVNGLRQYWSQFSKDRENVLISSIEENDINTWFDLRKESNGVRTANLGRLSALFSFALRKRWVTENPCDRVERYRKEVSQPRILTIEECEQLMQFVQNQKPCCMAYAALALFAGIRPEEITRLAWSDVHLDEAKVIVPANVSKVRRRRIVTLQPNAVAWLELAQLAGSTLQPSRTGRIRYVRAFRKLFGWSKWPQDVLRHTAASHMCVLYGSPGKVSMELGNSEKMLRLHYVDAVSKSDSDRFWSIAPTPQIKVAA